MDIGLSHAVGNFTALVANGIHNSFLLTSISKRLPYDLFDQFLKIRSERRSKQKGDAFFNERHPFCHF